MDARGLTPLELQVLEALLDGPGPLLAQLRRQLGQACVAHRERSGVGFFTSIDTSEAVPIGEISLRFGDVVAELEGLQNGAGFLLSIAQGRLAELEGYTFGNESWPATERVGQLSYIRRRRDLPRELLGTDAESLLDFDERRRTWAELFARHADWTSPWLNDRFVDGAAMPDGNPLASARGATRAVKVLCEPGTDEFTHWYSDFDGLQVLCVNVPWTGASLEEALQLVNDWLDSESRPDRSGL